MSSDPAASIRARLLNQARASGEEFERVLTRFAAERLLYRLGASPRTIAAFSREPACSAYGCQNRTG